jgi:type II secretory pathway predicted ATPase ExeA
MPDAYTAQIDDPISWLSLGFKVAPFTNTHTNDHLFFKSQALISTLNKLCTLDTSDTCATLLVGEKGCGKTTCLRALNKIRSHYKSILLSGTPGLNPMNLLKSALENRMEIGRNPTTEDCIQILKSLSTSKQQIRLLIDDADQLPQKSISLIKKMASIQPNGSHLQFVLCMDKKKTPEDVSGDAQLKTQMICLENLTRLETEKYLALKLQQSPDNKRFPMIPKEYIDKLYQRTRGNLFNINTDAAKSLPDFLQIQEAPKQTVEIDYYRYLPLALIPLIALTATLIQKSAYQKPAPMLKIEQTMHQQSPPSSRQISRLLYVLSQPELKSGHS